jgi:hypothetical protein
MDVGVQLGERCTGNELGYQPARLDRNERISGWVEHRGGGRNLGEDAAHVLRRDGAEEGAGRGRAGRQALEPPEILPRG